MKGIARSGIFVALIALEACLVGSDPVDPYGPVPRAGREPMPQRISVYAQNENAEDVVIYVLSVGRIEKLGTVAPEGVETFLLDWTSSQELRIRVEILAGPRYTTNALNTVSPGDRVEVWVPAEVQRSFIRRR